MKQWQYKTQKAGRGTVPTPRSWWSLGESLTAACRRGKRVVTASVTVHGDGPVEPAVDWHEEYLRMVWELWHYYTITKNSVCTVQEETLTNTPSDIIHVHVFQSVPVLLIRLYWSRASFIALAACCFWNMELKWRFRSFLVPSLSSFPVFHVLSLWLYSVCWFPWVILSLCWVSRSIYFRVQMN